MFSFIYNTKQNEINTNDETLSLESVNLDDDEFIDDDTQVADDENVVTEIKVCKELKVILDRGKYTDVIIGLTLFNLTLLSTSIAYLAFTSGSRQTNVKLSGRIKTWNF